jgi:hypothetical protein
VVKGFVSNRRKGGQAELVWAKGDPFRQNLPKGPGDAIDLGLVQKQLGSIAHGLLLDDLQPGGCNDNNGGERILD